MNTKIKIKKYVDDETLSWEERYKRLEQHHLEETKVLMEIIEELEWRYDSACDELGYMSDME